MSAMPSSATIYAISRGLTGKALIFASALVLLLGTDSWAQIPDGGSIFRNRCAGCHASGRENVPTQDQLALRPRFAIVAALDSGKMRIQGDALSPVERRAVAAFLSKIDTKLTDLSENNKCESAPPLPDGKLEGWNGWGVDAQNTRYQANTTIGVGNVPHLKLKWAFGLQNVDTSYAQPTLMGGRLFFGSADGHVYSLDADSGCTLWAAKTQEFVRAAISVARVKSQALAFFGDVGANVYAVDAQTGRQVWKVKVDDHPLARITGALTFHQDRLYVAVGSTEPAAAFDPNYACCTFRGSLVALDAASGKLLWKTYVVPQEPKPRGKLKGVEKFGPSGSPIWSAPTIDSKLRLVYAGTGDAYSDGDVANSDSIVAMDMDTGKIRWARQFTMHDSSSQGCIPGGPIECTPGKNPARTIKIDDRPQDVDFGSSTVLRELGNGKRILLAPQKSGVLWALDPDENGKLLWWARVGKGGPLGGILWGIGADETRAYVANGDSMLERTGKGKAGGLYAIRLSDGKVAWSIPSPAASCAGKLGCTSAQNQAVTVIPGLVFSGTLDGHLRAYASEDGKILWDFDTNVGFKPVNGVPAHGGSLGSSGTVVFGDRMFVGSGYGALGGAPGNVLLAFQIVP
jgi:polyvinyl alcohol dehydrogenase (cytochrome)